MAETVRDEFDEALERIDDRWDGSQEPGSFFSKDGDCLFFQFESAPSYGERVGDRLTVFRALRGGRIVSLQVKEVSELIGDSPGVVEEG